MSLNFKDKVSRTLAEVKVSKRVAGNPYNVSLGEVKLRSRLVRWLFYTLMYSVQGQDWQDSAWWVSHEKARSKLVGISFIVKVTDRKMAVGFPCKVSLEEVKVKIKVGEMVVCTSIPCKVKLSKIVVGIPFKVKFNISWMLVGIECKVKVNRGQAKIKFVKMLV